MNTAGLLTEGDINFSVERGKWDKEITDKNLLDFHGNNVHQLGHGNDYVVGKVIEQLHKLPFSPRRYTNEPTVELAKKLGIA